MKMRVYWVAIYDDDDETDMKCIAGPFPTWVEAFDAKDDALVVEQIVEVT